jgi:DNA-binding transcriptional LysR family regulator
MDLRQLEYVVAAAEELNFTRAAARCHVVQSALSHQIARLEHECGVRLFDRTSRSVRLTRAGERFLPHARRTLLDVERGRAELAAISGVLDGELRLGIAPIGGESFDLPRLLAWFHREHPGVPVTARNSVGAEMAGQVVSGDLDVAFVGMYADQLAAGVEHRLLTEEPLVAVASPAHPLVGRGPVDLGELAEIDSFVELRECAGLRMQVDAAFRRAGVARRIACELDLMPDLAAYTAFGLGTAIVPLSVAHRAAATRRSLAVLELHDDAARYPVAAIHRSPAPASPAARAFVSMLPVLPGVPASAVALQPWPAAVPPLAAAE